MRQKSRKNENCNQTTKTRQDKTESAGNMTRLFETQDATRRKNNEKKTDDGNIQASSEGKKIV
jgi:hypothetical protein